MEVKCYIVEFNSALGGLFEILEDHGFNSYNYRLSSIFGYVEIGIWCYPYQIQELEEIFAPYV